MDINELEKLNAFDGTVLKRLFIERQRRLEAEGKKVSLNVLGEEVANKIHSSRESIKRWAKGPRRGGHPNDYATVLALAKEFGVAPEVFERLDYVKNKDKVNSMNETTITGSSAENTFESSTDENIIEMYEAVNKPEINNVSRTALTTVYYDVSDFLETYRKTISGTGTNVLPEKFNTMYRNFRRLRLDIPRDVYDTLNEYFTEYLFMLTGIDGALTSYLKELFSRENDPIELIRNYACYGRIKMDETLWKEYMKLRESVINKNSYDIPYKDYISELCRTFEFEEKSGIYETEDFDFAAIYLLDLYAWIEGIWDFLWLTDYGVLISNVKQYKSTCISDAYGHLDRILSAYIPQ